MQRNHVGKAGLLHGNDTPSYTAYDSTAVKADITCNTCRRNLHGSGYEHQLRGVFCTSTTKTGRGIPALPWFCEEGLYYPSDYSVKLFVAS